MKKIQNNYSGKLYYISRKLEQINSEWLSGLFKYEESPMFIGFYEFIGKIQESYFEFGGVGRFDKIDNYLKSIPELKQKFEANDSNTESSLTGFTTTLSETQIIKLYTDLKDNNYIDCSELDFNGIFSDNPKPISWNKTKALLAYFINIFPKLTSTSRWKTASYIFISKDFNSERLQQTYTKSPFPRNWGDLDAIIKACCRG